MNWITWEKKYEEDRLSREKRKRHYGREKERVDGDDSVIAKE